MLHNANTYNTYMNAITIQLVESQISAPFHTPQDFLDCPKPKVDLVDLGDSTADSGLDLAKYQALERFCVLVVGVNERRREGDVGGGRGEQGRRVVGARRLPNRRRGTRWIFLRTRVVRRRV